MSLMLGKLYTQISPYLLLVFYCMIFTSCKKDNEVIVPDNNAPYYDGIPTVTVENYVNRLFIDLIGREPLDAEMDKEVKTLKDNNLDFATRDKLITKLQTNTDFIEGDSSYKHAYYNRFYEYCKSRMMEGASNAVIQGEIGIAYQAALNDSLAGDSIAFAFSKHQAEKLERVLRSEIEYREGLIEIDEIYVRMLNNSVYDIINMNTFNFVNAAFDDLFFREPSQIEFDNSFFMIENLEPTMLFSKSGQNKWDFIHIMVDTKEFYEGMIRWGYVSLIGREPTSQELYNEMNTFYNDHNFQEVQKRVLRTDEYANFNR